MAHHDQRTAAPSELIAAPSELIALNSERKRLAESLYVRGIITEEGLEKVRADPEVVGESEKL